MELSDLIRFEMGLWGLLILIRQIFITHDWLVISMWLFVKETNIFVIIISERNQVEDWESRSNVISSRSHGLAAESRPRTQRPQKVSHLHSRWDFDYKTNWLKQEFWVQSLICLLRKSNKRDTWIDSSYTMKLKSACSKTWIFGG